MAIHRAANILKRDSNARLLLTTFSLPLANALEGKLRILAGIDKGIVPRVTVLPFRGVAKNYSRSRLVNTEGSHRREQIRGALKAAGELRCDASQLRFLVKERLNVVVHGRFRCTWSLSRTCLAGAGRTLSRVVNQRETLWRL